MTVVLDTNIVASGTYWRGKPAPAPEAIAIGTKPKLATSAVISFGHRQVSVPSISSRSSVPKACYAAVAPGRNGSDISVTDRGFSHRSRPGATASAASVFLLSLQFVSES
jgi:hypothetical protein